MPPEKIIPEQNENEILFSLNKEYEQISEMTSDERSFLNALIRRKRPKKILEIGVAAGASSLLILNAIKDIEDSKLYSLDYSIEYYREKSKKSGFIVDDYPHLKDKWELQAGGLALEFVDKIGDGIDFCFIDTMHSPPGEILDFLMVLPYLAKDAIVVFHDTNLQTVIPYNCKVPSWGICNNLLMSSICADKIIMGEFTKSNPERKNFNVVSTNFANIGAMKLNEETPKHIWELFNLLTLNWRYIPSDEELEKVSKHFARFYPEYVDYFADVISYHKECHRFIDIEKKQSVVAPLKKRTFVQTVFSIYNEYSENRKHKVISILGFKIKMRIS